MGAAFRGGLFMRALRVCIAQDKDPVSSGCARGGGIA